MTLTVEITDDDYETLRMLCIRYKKTEAEVVGAVIREWRMSTRTERLDVAMRRTVARSKWREDFWPAWSDGYRTGWNHFQTRKPDCLPYREEQEP